MTHPQDKEARRFYRVAYQRLDDGELLLNKLDRPAAAIYLTGYAVECMLKAMILVDTPANKRLDVVRSFRGGRAHNLLWLREQLTNKGGNVPKEVAREFRFVNTWSTDLRYTPGSGDRNDAKRFVEAAKTILHWLDGRM